MGESFAIMQEEGLKAFPSSADRFAQNNRLLSTLFFNAANNSWHRDIPRVIYKTYCCCGGDIVNFHSGLKKFSV